MKVKLLDNSSRPDDAPACATITERQQQIGRMVARGLTNAEIADELFLSRNVVEAHVDRPMSKMDARDRAELAVLFHEG